MKIIDLTHTINENILMFPGDEKPKIVRRTSVDKDLYTESSLRISSHVGTHMDSSYHVYNDGIPLDMHEVNQFVGDAIVINVSSKNENEFITMKDLADYQEVLANIDYIIFNTGWHRKWNSEGYFTGYPIIDEEVAEYISISQIKGIGVDTISIDRTFEDQLKNHHILLKRKEFVVIENLTNLDKISGVFQFICLPLKWEDADGAPVRAIAIQND